MKSKKKNVIGCAVSVAALSMLTASVVCAEGTTDISNTKWSYTAVANVTTQVNIRAYASTDSAIIGYLPKAGAADVIERGETWTHVISNGVEGYIMNEYLAYGEEAKALAEVYGHTGVETSWDGVNVFAAPSAAANITGTANTGEQYKLVADEGLWYSVEDGSGNVAYLPKEDVSETIILEKAIPVQTAAPEAELSTVASDVSGLSGTEYTESTYDAPAVAEESYAEDTTTDYTEAYTEETPETYAETEAYTEETPVTETYTETEAYTEETTAETESAPSEETVTSASTDDLNLLAALIYCEAGNQSREGMVAVGAVVLNRVASGSFANSISGVIYESGQFTPAYSGALSNALSNGVPSSCYEAAQAALNGENPVGGALYFNTGSGRGVKIGAHQFY